MHVWGTGGAGGGGRPDDGAPAQEFLNQALREDSHDLRYVEYHVVIGKDSVR